MLKKQGFGKNPKPCFYAFCILLPVHNLTNVDTIKIPTAITPAMPIV